MKVSDIKCRKCGENAEEASKRGAWLKSMTGRGLRNVECRPSCKSHTKESAVVACLNAVEKSDESINTE